MPEIVCLTNSRQLLRVRLPSNLPCYLLYQAVDRILESHADCERKQLSFVPNGYLASKLSGTDFPVEKLAQDSIFNKQRSGERATTTSTSTSDLPPTHQQHLRLKAPRGGHIRLKPVSRAHGDQMPHITETERTGIGGARMAAKADKSTLRADKPFVRKPVRLAAKNPPGLGEDGLDSGVFSEIYDPEKEDVEDKMSLRNMFLKKLLRLKRS